MADPSPAPPSSASASVAGRTANLLRDSEQYRQAIVQARRDIRYAMQPEALLHGAVDYARGAVRARIGTLPALLPVAGGALRLLGRSRMASPAIASTVAASLIALFFWRRRHAREQAQSP